ncbi:hypothetical protein CFIO01_05570 [Colletotrichum fioriniae PJ7]|uniref:Heterokaryon incompatibility domain-containing protein n=1 Tax=Colletotrichum fioriniae PJ7 TaxID=1445577 RepID=A0A010Q936_9PEZI|nr:hypothetical protein CFIO01_05570 [Colletotrichum fioriniae PJ7]
MTAPTPTQSNEPSESRSSSAPFTNFYTPENARFYTNFRYQSLDNSHEEIRLLDVDLSGHNQHRLIHSVSLARAGKYSALSYHSGNPKDTVPVWIDNEKMNIFANLAQGINNAANFWKKGSPNQPLRLWVDQICINQSDVEEMSHQVNFMREIYRYATHVYVSMPIQRNLRPTFEWLASIEGKISKGYEPEPTMLYQHPPPLQQSNMRHDEDAPVPKWPAEPWEDLNCLIRHSWWSRSWIYQEVIVASDVFFLLSDDHSMSWNDLCSLLALFMNLDTSAACEKALHNQYRSHVIMQRFKPFASTELIANHMRSGRRTITSMDESLDGFDDNYLGYFFWNLTVPWKVLKLGGYLISAGVMSVPWALGCNFFRWPFCPGYEAKMTWKVRDRTSRDGLEHHLRRLKIPDISRTLVNRVIEGRALWRQHDLFELSYLLQHARNTETSQPKDKFYAFVGLTALKSEIPIKYEPTYSINTVLMDVAVAIIKHERIGLDILAQAGTSVHSRDLPRGCDPLPSWVPDWDKQEDIERSKFINALELPPGCAAGGLVNGSPTFSADRFGNKKRVLQASGVRIDTLGRVFDGSQDGFQSWRSFAGSDGKKVITTTSIAHFGDEVWVLIGMSWPVVLRRSTSLATTTLLAIAMVRENGLAHDIMFGRSELGEISQVVIV